MNRLHPKFPLPSVSLFALLGLLVVSVAPLAAEDAKTAPPPPATTTAAPEIPVDYLDLLLDPLTKDELLVEAEAWRDLLKAKVSEISAQEIATREKTKEIAETASAASPGGTPAAASEPESQQNAEKDQHLEALKKLREERAALSERLKTVLDSYEKKGGDPEELRKYASAVSSIKVEVTDTNATWAAVSGWITSKEGGVKWGLLLLKFAGIMALFWIVAMAAGAMMRKATSRNEGMSDMLRSFLNAMARRVVLFIGLLIALATVGVNVGAFLALIGGGAFILGFALQDTLGNFAAGMMLLFYRPFDVGDTVELGDVLGKVHQVSLVSTSIRTFDNKVVLVPNKQVWGKVIINLTGAEERRVDLVFGIGYSDDIDKAQAILAKIVKGHELVLKEPEPLIEMDELGESSVNFICRPWARVADFGRVRWDITRQVKKEFDAAGISIPFPQRDIHVYHTSGQPDVTAKE